MVVGCISNAFVRWIEFLRLDNCLAMITCNELYDCDGRAQVLFNELRELFGGGSTILDALRLDAFDNEEGVARVIGEGGSHTVSPVPATAHGTRVIYIGEFSAPSPSGVNASPPSVMRRRRSPSKASRSSPPSGRAYLREIAL